MDIDWSNPKSYVSEFFTVEEVLYLPGFHRLATAEDGLTDDVKEVLEWFAVEKMDKIRRHLDFPIVVHSWFRPELYNKKIGGALKSAHMARLEKNHIQIAACDFHPFITGDTQVACSYYAKQMIENYLSEWDIRMENNGDFSGWVHIDTKPPGHTGNRYFKP